MHKENCTENGNNIKNQELKNKRKIRKDTPNNFKSVVQLERKSSKEIPAIAFEIDHLKY